MLLVVVNMGLMCLPYAGMSPEYEARLRVSTPTRGGVVLEAKSDELATRLRDEQAPGPGRFTLAESGMIFIKVNLEEGDKKTQLNQINDDKFLMRHEFVEALLRIAVGCSAPPPPPKKKINVTLKRLLTIFRHDKVGPDPDT